MKFFPASRSCQYAIHGQTSGPWLGSSPSVLVHLLSECKFLSHRGLSWFPEAGFPINPFFPFTRLYFLPNSCYNLTCIDLFGGSCICLFSVFSIRLELYWHRSGMEQKFTKAYRHLMDYVTHSRCSVHICGVHEIMPVIAWVCDWDRASRTNMMLWGHTEGGLTEEVRKWFLERGLGRGRDAEDTVLGNA